MSDESAPPPVGSEPESSKKKLRLKVSRVEEDKPRVRRRVVTAVPAAPISDEPLPPTDSTRVGPARILLDLGRTWWATFRGTDRKIWTWGGVLLGMAVIYGVWTEWRKTVVRVRVELNDIRLGDKPEVLVLYAPSEVVVFIDRW